jgi:1-acyl-sn-glycerol-3-phosphate acyltransferase
MHGVQILATVGVGAWLLWTLFVHWLLRPGFRDGDLTTCFAVRFDQCYARLMHHLRVEGSEHIPARPPSGCAAHPLILVANHTSGVDPALIQAAVPYEVRWVMAEDMRVPRYEWFWRFMRIIFIDREAGEATGLREALRHLKSGGTLGLFPEGAIEKPPCALLPFKEGIGLLIARSRAVVLPVIIEGTPNAPTAWGSLTKASRSRLRFLPPIDFAAMKRSPGEVATQLRGIFAAATGWPMNDKPAKFEQGRWWYVDEEGAYRPET